MTRALLRCGAVWAVAAIAWWGRECRCDIGIRGSACRVGHYCTPLSEMECSPGTYCVDAVMKPCAIGTYTSITGATTCDTCVYNRFNTEEGQPNCRYCRDCTAGQYVYSACVPTADRVCRACGQCYPGQYIGARCGYSSDIQCIACTAGQTYSNQYNVEACTRCSTCSAGQIQTRPCSYAHDMICRDTLGSCCEQCRDGYLYKGGAYDSISNCDAFCGGQLCNTGAYAETSQCSYCLTCQPGSYCVADTKTPCPAGTYSDSYGQTACTGCTVGVNYAAGIGSGACTAITVCQPGTRVSLAPTASTDKQCTPCVAPWTSTTTNAAACDVCIAGYYKRGSTCYTCSCSGATYINCPQGSISQTCSQCTGSVAGSYCVIGKEPNPVCTGVQRQDTTCEVCPAGKEKLSASVRDCSKCPTGKYKIGANTNACGDCTNPSSSVSPKGVRYDVWGVGATPSSNTCPW
jgi:hypothetical protein